MHSRTLASFNPKVPFAESACLIFAAFDLTHESHHCASLYPCIFLGALHQSRLTCGHRSKASLPDVGMPVCSSSIHQGIMLVHMLTLSVCKGDTISLIFLIALTSSVAVCAALSTHAGRNQRSLPDKRARRKPGWLDNTVDPKQAAQLALHQAAADVSLDAALLYQCTCCSPLPCKPRCCCAWLCCCCFVLMLLLCSAALLCCCCCALLLLLCCYSAAR